MELCGIKKDIMKIIITTEEVAQFAIGIFCLYLLPFSFSWWLWMLLFLAPDISMIGYALGNKAGAIMYNIFHYKAVALACLAVGIYMKDDVL